MVLTACATPAPPIPEVDPTPVNSEPCLAGLRQSAALLATDELTQCTHDVDCAVVTQVVSGRCGVFANLESFAAHLEELEANTAACDGLVRVVPTCPQVHAVCTAGRCASEAISSMPDECTEATAALDAAAKKDSGACETDTECVLLHDSIPATSTFAASHGAQRDDLERACGTPAGVLYAVREPATPTAFCVERRCASAQKFTTINRAAMKPPRPEYDMDCFVRQLEEALNLRKHFPFGFVFHVKVRVAATGEMNHFEFTKPLQLPDAVKLAIASRLHECRPKPARFRGKPVEVMDTLKIQFEHRRSP